MLRELRVASLRLALASPRVDREQGRTAMILIGMFDSPFVRRVAVSLKRLGFEFEHANWSVGRDFEMIREYNPLGRVPTLVLDDGESLVESAAILDYLDEQAGSARALLPVSGAERREALQLMAIATGAADKAVAQVYERAFRPVEKRHEPWVARCRAQVDSALGLLEAHCLSRAEHTWLIGTTLTQADITVTCACSFIAQALASPAGLYPSLERQVQRCEQLPEFRATYAAFSAPAD
jgi:glutathione S-transferase